MTTLKGQQAPLFTLPNESGDAISLEDYRGKYVVLYFYPKDNTPGCTTEALDFTAALEDFEKEDAVILGVSPDSVESHAKFAEKKEIPFHLLADVEKEVANLYHVWALKKNFGREYMGIERSTFLIDPEGTIIEEWRRIRVKGHVEKVLNALKEARQS